MEARKKEALTPIKFDDVAAEFLQRNEKQKLSEAYQKASKKFLKRMSKYIGKSYIDDITAKEIGAAVDKEVSGGPRAYNNLLGAVAGVFSFVRKQGYLSRTEKTEAEIVEHRNVDRIESISIYTPEEFHLLLNNIGDDLVPFIALGGLAGIRTEEIFRRPAGADTTAQRTASPPRTQCREAIRLRKGRHSLAALFFEGAEGTSQRLLQDFSRLIITKQHRSGLHGFLVLLDWAHKRATRGRAPTRVPPSSRNLSEEIVLRPCRHLPGFVFPLREIGLGGSADRWMRILREDSQIPNTGTLALGHQFSFEGIAGFSQNRKGVDAWGGLSLAEDFSVGLRSPSAFPNRSKLRRASENERRRPHE